MPEDPSPGPLEETAEAISEAVSSPDIYGLRQWSGWVLGPAMLAATLMLPAPAGLSAEGWHTAGVGGLMAVLWITEAIPIPVTALLPLILFPALQLSDIRETAAPYANPIIFLFLGGFIIALAMQRWNLQRRVAITLIGAMGTRPTRIIAGFLTASALISMWVSNTATALMMLPIAASVVALLPADARRTPALRGFGAALLLSVAYGATTGGMATLIGTPPNALLAAYVNNVYHTDVGFAQWMLLGVPVTLVTLAVVYLVLTRVSFHLGHEELEGLKAMLAEERARLGRPSRGEKAVAVVFLMTALGWILQPFVARAVPLVSDTTIAMAGAVALFLIPVDARRGEFAMNWQATRGLPWDVLLLFGGGLSLAGNIERHGLSRYLGSFSSGLEGVPVIVTLCIVCFIILMLGELTSNTATAATFLPIAGATAIGLGQNPLLFLIPATLISSCSFMLPVGTPPNAIVFGSGLITLPQMAKAGFILDMVMIPIIVGLVLLLGPMVFDVQLNTVPAWVK